MTSHLDPAVRHDFVLVFDVENGNPNGDPDNGNAPRMDPETGHGWVTDGALKRKIRNFVSETKGGASGFGIYVGEGVALNSRNKAAAEAIGAKPSKQNNVAVQGRMCQEWWDIRAFGAVLSTGDYPAGQVRGPIQMTMAVSAAPISIADLTITRVAVTSEEALKKLAADEKGGKDREMGSRNLVPYALFTSRGFFVPSLAARTGFGAEDLALFWDALQRMWYLDRSSSRGVTGCRGVHIFSHDDALGRCHPDKLFQRVKAAARRDVQFGRSFADYEVTADVGNLPDGISYVCLGE